VFAAIRAAMATRAALAARKQSAQAQIPAVPKSIREMAYVAPPPSPERPAAAGARGLEDEPTQAPTTTEKRPRNDRGGTEPPTGPTTDPEVPQTAGEGPRSPRVRRPGSRPFTVTTGAPAGRPDAWRYVARPEARNDDDPPDE
jgi:hypothetical protein